MKILSFIAVGFAILAVAMVIAKGFDRSHVRNCLEKRGVNSDLLDEVVSLKSTDYVNRSGERIYNVVFTAKGRFGTAQIQCAW